MAQPSVNNNAYFSDVYVILKIREYFLRNAYIPIDYVEWNKPRTLSEMFLKIWVTQMIISFV